MNALTDITVNKQIVDSKLWELTVNVRLVTLLCHPQWIRPLRQASIKTR